MKACTFDAALDLLDTLRDDLAAAPKTRSAVMREVVNAVRDLSNEQRAELVACGHAADMYGTAPSKR